MNNNHRVLPSFAKSTSEIDVYTECLVCGKPFITVSRPWGGGLRFVHGYKYFDKNKTPFRKMGNKVPVSCYTKGGV